jgi:glycosyltransferase involved in cell wall biosynthesis
MLDNEFPPLGGGTGVVNYHLLKELASYRDVSVDLVTASRSTCGPETEQFAQRITIYKVPGGNRNIHHATNGDLCRYAWRALWLCRTLLKRQDYDLSFAFAGVPAGAISYILKQRHKLPYLVSLQGPDVPGFEARYNYLYPFLKPLVRRIWSEAAVVTAISKDHRRLAHGSLPDLDIAIVPNGVDTGSYYPAEALRRTAGLNILCTGRLIERKGQHHLLRAFACLLADSDRSLRLTLAGAGDAEDRLHRLALSLGLGDSVTFTGAVPREDMPTMYRQADMFVLPSQNEGMSMALLEAMASGLPVVVTNTGGTSELVVEARHGHIVPWGDISALTEALADLVRDEHARHRMGHECRQRAMQFVWPTIVRQYLDLCERIAARSHPGAVAVHKSCAKNLASSNH